MIFLSDYSNIEAQFARKLGSKDKKPRVRKILGKLGRATWNSNTAGAAATGSALGYAIGRSADALRKSNNSYGEVAGLLGGLAVGGGLGIRNQYRKQKP